MADMFDVVQRHILADPSFMYALSLGTVPGQRITGQEQGAPLPQQSPMVQQPGASAQVPVNLPGGSFDDMRRLTPPPSQPPQVQQSQAMMEPGFEPPQINQSGSGGGFLSNLLPSGVANPLTDAMTGLAYSDASASPLTAFGQAFAGAQQSSAAREERKREEQRLAAQAAIDQEKLQAWREDRGVAAEDRTREIASDEAKAERQARKDSLAEITAFYGLRKTQIEIDKLEREYAKRPGLDPNEVEAKVASHMNSWSQRQEYQPTDDEFRKEDRRYRKELFDMWGTPDEYRGQDATGDVGDIGGAGSDDDPYDFTGMSEQSLLDFFNNKMKPGEVWIDPFTGEKHVKD